MSGEATRNILAGSAASARQENARSRTPRSRPLRSMGASFARRGRVFVPRRADGLRRGLCQHASPRLAKARLALTVDAMRTSFIAATRGELGCYIKYIKHRVERDIF